MKKGRKKDGRKTEGRKGECPRMKKEERTTDFTDKIRTEEGRKGECPRMEHGFRLVDSGREGYGRMMKTIRDDDVDGVSWPLVT